MTKANRLVVLVDSREKCPFSFSPAVETQVDTLTCGDYSLRGFEQDIAIERKSLNDLISSLTVGRERFKRELMLLRSFRFKCLLVEATWADVLAGSYRSKTSANSIVGSLMSFAVRYNLITLMGENHEIASQLCERLLLNFSNHIRQDHKKLLERSLAY